MSGPESIDEALDARERLQAHSPEPARGTKGDLDARLAKILRNDMGNGERLRARHGEDLIFVRDVDWYIWAGDQWSRETGMEEAHKRAHETARSIFREAETLDEDGEKKQHYRLAIESGGAGRIRAMLSEATPYLTQPVTALDANPYLFNVQNGTLLLEGSCETLRGHQRRDLITRVAPVAFDPDAQAPKWRRFLDEVQPDVEIQTFLQRWAGYNLTGCIYEEVLVFLYGRGANGKTTFLDVIGSVMGAYATQLPFQSLLHNEYRGGGDASPDLARLPGARFVTASEPETGTRFSEATIKTLVGGRRQLVRHLRRDFFEYDPHFKLTLSGNNKPAVRGQDDGIWRRLLIVPFGVQIPREERNPNLLDELLAESPGILNWMLDGCRLWLERGLEVPHAVRHETDIYRAESDSLGEFLAACTERVDGATVYAADVYQAYEKWCGENGVDPVKKNGFGRRMTERGFKRDKQGTMVYLGLRLYLSPPGQGADVR